MTPMKADTSLKEHGLLSLVLRRWRVMGLTLGVVLALGATAMWLAPAQYQATAKLLVMRTDQRTGGLRILNETMPALTYDSNPLFTQIELLRVDPVFEQVIETLGLRDAEGRPLAPASLARHVTIKPIAQTDMIELSYIGRDPVLAQRVLDAICQTYLAQAERYRQEGVQDGLKYVDQQLEAAKRRLEAAENKLLAYKREAGTIAVSQEILSAVNESSAIDLELGARKSALAQAQARASSLRKQLGLGAREALQAVALSQNPTIRSLQDQLVQAQSSPLRSQGLGEGHPDLVALNQRIAMLRRQIDQEVTRQLGRQASVRQLDPFQLELLRKLAEAEGEVSANRSAIQVAERRKAELSSARTRLPQQEVEVARLSREVEVASEIYQSLLQKREEARLQLGMAPTFVKVIEPPQLPQKPQAPLKGPAGPIWAIIALATAMGAGALRELLDRRVDPAELPESLPELSIYAALPTLTREERRAGSLLAERGEAPHYLEALRALGLALEDNVGGAGCRVLGLTSAAEGEGKSVTMANLALCLAEARHRVLLIDADLHRPSIHQIFRLPNGVGLSDVLLDAATPQDVIRSGGPIDLVLAGRGHVTSLSAFRHRLGAVLETWKQSYDFVLVDMPPLIMPAEVAHLGKHANGLLLLANLQMTSVPTLIGSVQQMQALRLPLSGLVALSPMIGKQKTGYYLLAQEGPAA